MYYVYVIKSELLNKTYVGQTDDLELRLKQHNGRLKVFDWKLIHIEQYPTRSLAIRRERYLKTGDGRAVFLNKDIV
ncbi:MAG: GIY-YIG nuclease family protein [Candidatus Omnitrophica bacterium]|nr:GIY-YIG nuclease family protein [Candidatus Omnitrophota bacterium]